MKKLIIITVAIVTLALTSVILADTGDVEITITIPAAKVPAFREAFLAYLPVPIEEIYDPNDPDVSLGTQPKYTEKQWIRQSIIDWLFRYIRKGRIEIARLATVSDPNAIE